MNPVRSWNLAIVTLGLCLAAFLASVIASAYGWHPGTTVRTAGASGLAMIGCGLWLNRAAGKSGPLDPEPGTGATHVLHWVPPYVDGEGTWELQTCADYDAGKLPSRPDWMLESEPRDIDAGDFTGWIAGITGYPVTVEQDWVRITCPRAFRFMRREPLWWVRPAYVPEVTS